MGKNMLVWVQAIFPKDIFDLWLVESTVQNPGM